MPGEHPDWASLGLLMASLTLAVAACGISMTTPAVPTSVVAPVASPHVGTTEGCAADEWRQPQFFDSWEEYQPGDLVGSVFPRAGPYFDMTLAQALEPSAAIGPDPGAALVREAVAALLNAAHEELEYPYRRYEEGVDGRPAIVPTVDRLLASGTIDEVVELTSDLADANGLGCPLD
jgi:hypothetical protein